MKVVCRQNLRCQIQTARSGILLFNHTQKRISSSLLANDILQDLFFPLLAMDPITVGSFLAEVVQVIDVTSKVVYYLNNVKDAPIDQAMLMREAISLLALFADLRYRVEETISTDPWFTSLGGDEGPLMEFAKAMEAIVNGLTQATWVVNHGRVLRWTLNKKEIDAILSRIERMKTVVGLALQKNHL